MDHINNDGFKDRLYSKGRSVFYYRIRKQNYPNTYQLLCMNCNFGKHINKGTCPHKNGVIGIADSIVVQDNAA